MVLAQEQMVLAQEQMVLAQEQMVLEMEIRSKCCHSPRSNPQTESTPNCTGMALIHQTGHHTCHCSHRPRLPRTKRHSLNSSCRSSDRGRCTGMAWTGCMLKSSHSWHMSCTGQRIDESVREN